MLAGSGEALGTKAEITLDQGGLDENATLTIGAVQRVGRGELLNHVLVRLPFLCGQGGTLVVFCVEDLAAAAEGITTFRCAADTLDEATVTVTVVGVGGVQIRCFGGRRGRTKVDELIRRKFVHADDAIGDSGTLGRLDGRGGDNHVVLRVKGC